jgi:membrane-associated phospholipid phosphatase
VGIALFTSTSVLALRVFACVMPTLMAFAVVATANHWILDVFGGLVVVTAGVAVSELLAARARSRDAKARMPTRARETVRELN